uniref:Uncharacterized protein n=1 Tax=Caenorhabditis japonica TaxID=281687 RepID=A0A8R1IA09_CAEJA
MISVFDQEKTRSIAAAATTRSNRDVPHIGAPIAVSSVIREAVPIKRKRHHFDNARCEEENPPKDVTKPLVTSIVLAHIQSFRARSSERDTPIEDPKKPQFAPAEADPEQMVPIPVTQFEIFVHHAHRGFAAVLPPVHQATTVNNRPVLRFIYFFRDLHRKAQQVAHTTS